MKTTLIVLTALGVALTSIVQAQTTRKRSVARTYTLGRTATFDYIQGKLRSLTPEDGSNDFKTATFDESTCSVRIEHKADWKQSYSFADLDINNTRWSIFDPNAKGQSSRALIVKLSLYTYKDLSLVEESLEGKTEKMLYSNLLFSLPKAAEIPNFQEKMSKAVKHLIGLCSGQSEIEPF